MGYTAQAAARRAGVAPRPPVPSRMVSREQYDRDMGELRQELSLEILALKNEAGNVLVVDLMAAPEVVDALAKAGALLSESDAELSKLDSELDTADAEIESLKAEVATLTDEVAAATAMLEEAATAESTEPDADNPTDAQPIEDAAPTAQTESDAAPDAAAEDEPDAKPQGKDSKKK